MAFPPVPPEIPPINPTPALGLFGRLAKVYNKLAPVVTVGQELYKYYYLATGAHSVQTSNETEQQKAERLANILANSGPRGLYRAPMKIPVSPAPFVDPNGIQYPVVEVFVRRNFQYPGDSGALADLISRLTAQGFAVFVSPIPTVN